jgi:hypothetical protein
VTAQEGTAMTGPRSTTTLWRPTGPRELERVRELKWRAWPPRLPEQPIFYPVLNEDYAIRIARDWNVKHDGAGFVTRFEVGTEFLGRYPVRRAGGETILELRVPAESWTSSTPTSSAVSRSSTSSAESGRGCTVRFPLAVTAGRFAPPQPARADAYADTASPAGRFASHWPSRADA